MSTPEPDRRSAAGFDWMVLLLVTSVHAVVAVSSTALPTIAPAVAAELGVSASLVGVQISLVFAAAMIAALFAGAIVRRMGACRTIQIAQTMVALAMLLTMVPSLPSMGLGALLMGVSYGLANPATGHVLFRFSDPRRRNTVFSIKQAGVPIGGILAGFIVPRIATTFGWQAAIGGVGLLSVALVLVLQRYRLRWDDDRDAAAPLRQNPFGGLALVWRTPALRWLSLTAACYGGIQVSSATFLVTILVEDVGFTILSAGVTFAVFQFSGLLGRILVGWMSDRIGALSVLFALGIVLTAGTLLTSMLSPAWEPWLVNIMLAGFGFAALSWAGIFLAQIAHHSQPGLVGTTTGGSMVFNFVGIAVVPALVSSSYALVQDYRVSFIALALIGLGGTATAYLAARSVRTA